ncbi:unnamed protein product [Closterium sp. Naga37s-1]|nr:unnamed protein product [Closterium sp. Naga37s-1]
MASSRFPLLAASFAVLLLAATSCTFAARHRPDAASTAAVKPPKPLACAKSTLKDYAKSVKLAKSLFFHWNITDAKDGIIAALEDKTAGSGWISVGWTGSVGKMFPSDVVVGNHVSRFTGNTNDVLAYSWTGKTDWTYSKAAGGFTLSDVSILRGVGGTIVKFTRTGKGGSVSQAVSYDAGVINNMIWASSKARPFGKHTKRGSFAVNFGCTV